MILTGIYWRIVKISRLIFYRYFIFLIPITTIAGTPRYIPMFNIITEIPILNTSDSEFAFSIRRQ